MDIIKRRSFYQRLIRTPCMCCKLWKLSDKATLIDRIFILFASAKIVLRR